MSIKSGIILSLCLVISAGTAAGSTYTGSLSSLTTPPGVTSQGAAWDEGQGWTNISWEVSTLGDPLFSWHYSYTISVPVGGVSHFILEVSDSFDSLDLIQLDAGSAVTLDGPEEFGPGGSNPGIPEGLWGIKFSPDESPTTFSFGFSCARAPIWGDFYAKDGMAGQSTAFNAAWNAGFTLNDVDPTAPPASGSVGWHILVPDTFNTSGEEPVPEPTAVIFFCTGLAGVLGFVVRRRIQGSA
jgi:hypothetical protein